MLQKRISILMYMHIHIYTTVHMQTAISACHTSAYQCTHAPAHIQEAITACCGNASEVEGMHGIVSEVLHSVEEWAPVYEIPSFSEFLDFLSLCTSFCRGVGAS